MHSVEVPDIGILSARLLMQFQGALYAELRKQGHERMRPRHGAVMAHLDLSGTRASTLAARSGMHKQAIGTVVDELVELGYVRRDADPTDRRAKLVVPTELGRDEMSRVVAIIHTIETNYRSRLTVERWEALKSSMADLIDSPL